MYLFVCVHDLILIGNDIETVSNFVKMLPKKFSLKDFGPLSYFLGVEVVPHKIGLFLSRLRYIANLLARTKMSESKLVTTPLTTNLILTLQSGISTNLIEYSTL